MSSTYEIRDKDDDLIGAFALYKDALYVFWERTLVDGNEAVRDWRLISTNNPNGKDTLLWRWAKGWGKPWEPQLYVGD